MTGKPQSKKANASSSTPRLRQVLDTALKVARAKGWYADEESYDSDQHRYASLSVERKFGWDRTITGVFEFTLHNNVVKMTTESTSFYSNGLSDLKDAIWESVGDIPWMGRSIDKKEKSSADSEIISRVLRRFHSSVRQLKHRYGERTPLEIKDEYDVQDYLHAILRSLFDDIRAEEYTPSYAGGCSRIDFLLKSQLIAIEVKMASPSLRDRKVGEQLLIDIQRYQSHPSCKILFCLIYDPTGEIRNPAGLESDLTKLYDKLDVRVIVVSPA